MAWERILYRKQPYPDNYTDPSFLSSLRRNHELKIYTYCEAIAASAVLTKQICAVVLFIVVYHLALLDVINETILLLLTSVLALLGFVLRWIRDPSFGAFYSSIKELSLLMGAVLTLSPVLMTLTETIADDTVWASAVLLLLFHLFTFDYDLDLLHAPRLIAPLSLNAATFAAVLLSSRLRTPLHAFGLISFAVEIFALYPIMRQKIRQSSGRKEDPKLAVMMVSLLLPLLFVLSSSVLYAFLALVIVVTFLLPPLFVYLQKDKNVINGPWDEAVPDVCNS